VHQGERHRRKGIPREVAWLQYELYDTSRVLSSEISPMRFMAKGSRRELVGLICQTSPRFCTLNPLRLSIIPTVSLIFLMSNPFLNRRAFLVIPAFRTVSPIVCHSNSARMWSCSRYLRRSGLTRFMKQCAPCRPPKVDAALPQSMVHLHATHNTADQSA
jgi:hypothetical protein